VTGDPTQVAKRRPRHCRRPKTCTKADIRWAGLVKLSWFRHKRGNARAASIRTARTGSRSSEAAARSVACEADCVSARRRQTNERVKVGDCRSQGRLRSRSFKAWEKRQSACPRDRRLGLIQDQPVELLLRISRSNASGVKRGTVMRRSLPPVRRPSSNRLTAAAYFFMPSITALRTVLT
jgi:hypothetical protein